MTTRRIRRKATKSNLGVPRAIKQDILDIVEAQEEIERLRELLSTKSATVYAFMDDNRLSTLKGKEDTVMLREVKKGRNSSHIEPDDMYKAVNNDINDFFDCVKVVQAQAKSVVPGNVLDKIKVVTQGKDTTVYNAKRT